jgi:hypothetical protein
VLSGAIQLALMIAALVDIWRRITRRLGGGRDMGCGEDGMGNAAIRRSLVSIT